jgi:hypothetical protein
MKTAQLFCQESWWEKLFSELWMMDRTVQLGGPVKKETFGEMTVLTPNVRGSTNKLSHR